MENLLYNLFVFCLSCFTILSVILIFESANKTRYFRVYIQMKDRIRNSVGKLKTRTNSDQVKKAA